MEEEKLQPEENTYEPRPAWQVLVARIGLVVFIILVILQIVQMVRGFH